jgi:TolA-binding protein
MQSLPVFKALPDADSVFLWSLQFRNIQLMNAPMAGGIFLSYPNGIQLPYEAIKQQYNITNILESFVYYYINFCLHLQHTTDSQCICNFCRAFVQQSSETAIQAYSSAEVLGAQMQGLCNVFQNPFFVTCNMLVDCNNTPRFPSQVQQVQYPSPILNIYPPTYDTSTNISTDITKENFQEAATQYTPITSIEQLKAISQQHLNHDTKIQQYEEQIQEMKQQIQDMQQQFREQLYKQEQKQLQEQYQAQQQHQHQQQQLQQPQLIYYQYPQQYIRPPLLQPIPIIQQNEKKLYSKSAHYNRIYSYRIPIKYNELIYSSDIICIIQYIRESLPIDEISHRTGIKMIDIHLIIMHIIFDLYNRCYNHDYVAKEYNIDRQDVAKYIELYRYLSYNKMLQ